MSLTPAQLKGQIKSIANKNHADARVLLRIYMMERFLERLAGSAYKGNFILKGGVLVTSMVGVAMRSTMDIDASIKNLNLSKEDILKTVTEIAMIPLDDGVSFEVKRVSDIMDNFEYPGVRLELNALMGGMVTPIKIDVSTGDVITPNEISYAYPLLLEDRTISLLAYNPETVLAEKLQTILARDIYNTRMRDFYDVYILLKVYAGRIDGSVLREAFGATNRHRKTDPGDAHLRIERLARSPELQNLWAQYRTRYAYASEINFDDVMKSVAKLAQSATVSG